MTNSAYQSGSSLSREDFAPPPSQDDTAARRATKSEWWRKLTLQGDPIRRPNLVGEAFNAGWDAATALDQAKEKPRE